MGLVAKERITVNPEADDNYIVLEGYRQMEHGFFYEKGGRRQYSC